LPTYRYRCVDVKPPFSEECSFAATAETKEELWARIGTHVKTHCSFSKGGMFADLGKDVFEEHPDFKKAIENAIRET